MSRGVFISNHQDPKTGSPLIETPILLNQRVLGSLGMSFALTRKIDSASNKALRLAVEISLPGLTAGCSAMPWEKNNAEPPNV